MAEVSETESKEKTRPERLIQASLPLRLIAELDRVAAPTGRNNRGTIIVSWLDLALESIDPQTGNLPKVHPETGRTL